METLLSPSAAVETVKNAHRVPRAPGDVFRLLQMFHPQSKSPKYSVHLQIVADKFDGIIIDELFEL